MKKILRAAWCFLVLPLLVGTVWCAPKEKALPAVVVMSTREAGSSSYGTNVPISVVVSKYAGFKMSVEPAGGFDKTIPYVERGEIQLVHATSLEVLPVAKGVWWVKEARPWIRNVLSNYDSSYVWMTQADSGITSFKDLEGKRLASSHANWPASEFLTNLLLENHGVTKVTWIRTADGTAANQELIEGRADLSLSSCSPRLMDLEKSPHGMRLLPTTQQDVDYVNKKFGSIILEMQRVAAGYLGLKVFAQETKQLGDRGCWVTHKDVSEEVIYRLVKTTYEHYAEYKDAYPKCGYFTLENALKAFPAPYHPGAIKYFKEKGIWTSAHDKMQKDLLAALKK